MAGSSAHFSRGKLSSASLLDSKPNFWHPSPSTHSLSSSSSAATSYSSLIRSQHNLSFPSRHTGTAQSVSTLNASPHSSVRQENNNTSILPKKRSNDFRRNLNISGDSQLPPPALLPYQAVNSRSSSMNPLLELAYLSSSLSDSTDLQTADNCVLADIKKNNSSSAPMMNKPVSSLQNEKISMLARDVCHQINSSRSYTTIQQIISKYYRVIFQDDPTLLSLAFLQLAVQGSHHFRSTISTLDYTQNFSNNAYYAQNRLSKQNIAHEKDITASTSTKYYKDKSPTKSTLSSLSSSMLPSSSKSRHNILNALSIEAYKEFKNQTDYFGKKLEDLFHSCKALFDNNSLINFMKGMAIGGIKKRDIYDEIAFEIRKRLNFTTLQLKEAFSSYTKFLELNTDEKGGINLTIHDSSFIKFLLKLLVAEGEGMENGELNCSDLSELVRCASRLNISDAYFLKALGRVVLRKQKQFNEKDWSKCVSAFSRFGVPLRDNCDFLSRPINKRDWEHPPAPKRPKPMSEC